MAFAGSAAADVQDVNGLTAGDVTPGPDQVTQTVTIENVENDENAGTINISNGVLNDSIINESATTVSADNGHSASVRTVESDGTIVVDLAANNGTTDDIELTVSHNLSASDLGNLGSSTVDNLPTDVTYTATTEANDISVSDTFTVTEKQPEFTAASVPESASDTIELQFDEEVDATGDVTQITLNNVTNATGSDLSVTGSESNDNDQNVTLTLDGLVASNASNLEATYEISGTGPIVHDNDDGVGARNFTDATVTNNARPALVNAKVTDSNPDRLVMDFSEPLDSGSNSNIASNFSLSDNDANIASSGAVFENTTQGPDDQVILNLSTSVAPGANLTGLSYDGNDALSSSLSSANLDGFSGATVTNNVVPDLQSAEVTDANKSVIVASYQDGATVEVDTESNFEGGSGTTLSIVDSSSSDDFGVSLASNEVALVNDSAFAAASGSSLELNDTSGGVVSTAGITSSETNNVGINNNVTPTVESATVTDANPDQLRITFSESVQANVSDGNIDSAVTDAFTLEDQSGDSFRIRNVSSGLGGDTLTLNLGEADGTPVTVQAGDDLTDALDYDPTAPSGGEQFPLNASAGTNADVGAFSNQDVTNNIDAGPSVIDATVTNDELSVTFADNNIERTGTESELANAFSVDGSVISISDDSFARIEDDDTVVFSNTTGDGFVAEPDNYNSSLDLTGALDYTSVELANATTDSEIATSNNVDVQNNIQPEIESAEVTNANPGEIRVTFSENVTSGSADDFSLDGSDAPSINDVTTNGNSILVVGLASDVEDGDDLGTLNYTGDSVESAEPDGNDDSNAVAAASEASVNVNVGAVPTLQSAVVDDASENDGTDAEGEVVLTFNRDVSITGSSPGTAAGLTFASGNQDISVTLQNVTDPGDSPEDVVVANFTSDSGSVESGIEEGDDLSSATITVDNAGSVDIEDADSGNQITSGTQVGVSNEIAGGLTDVDSVSVNATIVGVDRHPAAAIEVTVSGFTDGDETKVIDDSVDISIGGDNDVGTVSAPRFGDTVSFTVNPTNSIDEGAITVDGDEVTADVADDSVSVSNTENVTYVHAAFTASDGYQLVSQPMPGELVTSEDIDDVSYYDADEDAFDSYGEDGEVQNVHNGLFLNANTSGAEYGFVYDTDRSGQQTNVGSIGMDSGWHIVGSNFDIQAVNGGGDTPTIGSDGIYGNANVTLATDLATQSDPESDALDVQLTSLPGTTLANDDTVGANGVYYVFVFENDSRAIVLPEYTE